MNPLKNLKQHVKTGTYFSLILAGIPSSLKLPVKNGDGGRVT